jgi:hypothetical protein
MRLVRRAALGLAAAGLVVTSLVVGAAPQAGAGTTSLPPSPLDLIAQVGAILNAQSQTERALLSLDAQIRNELNGTTGGFVYNLASDAIQALVGPLKDIVSDVKEVHKDLVEARAYASRMRGTWWPKEWRAYDGFQRKTYGGRTGKPPYGCMFPLPGPPPPGLNPTCEATRTLVKTSYNYQPTAVLMATPVPPVAGTGVYPNGMLARRTYAKAYGSVVEVGSATLETLTAARAIVGDAKDYPGNKLFEAILQVLGEHRLTTALGHILADRLPLVKRIQTDTASLTTCLNAAGTMLRRAFTGWGNAPKLSTTPKPATCASTTP